LTLANDSGTLLEGDEELSKPLGASPEDTFWFWIKERHNIYLKRKAGLPKPWTTDPVLQVYRFCNPFRENDKVTTWLREHFIPLGDGRADCVLAFNLVWFRMFNRIETAAALGFQDTWEPEAVKALLRERAKAHPVFTGAYIIRSEFGKPKIDSIVDTLTKVYDARQDLVDEINASRSLQHVTRWLTRFPYIGDFMAFEMVSDMRHTRLLDTATDIMTWANPGPGAYRGLRRMFGEPKMRKDGQVEQYLVKTKMVPLMQELLARSSEKLGPDFPPLEMRDIEHSLCEVDKYCRVKFNEGRPRQLYPGGANTV
jgi:hypothetical protein